MARRIVCQFRQKDEEALAREEDEQKKKLGIVARQITSLEYKMDGAGYLPQEKWHIWCNRCDLAGRQSSLPQALRNETEPRWSPDGQQILFVSNRSADPAQETDADDLYPGPGSWG